MTEFLIFVAVFVVLYVLGHWALDGFPCHRHNWEAYLYTTGMNHEKCAICGNKRTTHNGNVISWG